MTRTEELPIDEIIQLSPEQTAALEKLAKDTGMSLSEVILALVQLKREGRLPLPHGEPEGSSQDQEA